MPCYVWWFIIYLYALHPSYKITQVSSPSLVYGVRCVGHTGITDCVSPVIDCSAKSQVCSGIDSMTDLKKGKNRQREQIAPSQ